MYVAFVHLMTTSSDPATSTSDSISLPPWLTPVISTGVVGIFLLMILFRIKIMPTYVHDEAREQWDKQLADLKAEHDKSTKALNEEIARLRVTVDGSSSTYTAQIIPALTRAMDINREYLDIRNRDAFRAWDGNDNRSRTPPPAENRRPRRPGYGEELADG